MLPGQRRHQHQKERLHVIDDRGHADARIGVGMEQRHPVDHQRHATRRQPLAVTRANAHPFAPQRHPSAQRRTADQTAQQHHSLYPQATFDHEQPDGARQQHRQGHAPRATALSLRGIGRRLGRRVDHGRRAVHDGIPRQTLALQWFCPMMWQAVAFNNTV
ncbi:hypothetical protein SDC9_135883 [bioreactor metagenome]|uniref:Uncharacterized protein n=1 Tax=bioreactor metagenome TaxID=1076179 RepID=A0A645DHK7_9ZZZZ